MKSTLAKFTKGRDNLNILLRQQRYIFNKAGIGYKPTSNQKFYENFFVLAIMSSNPFTTCFYCSQKVHKASSCAYKNDRSCGQEKEWVPIISSNSKGPKMVWIPKNKGWTLL